MTPTFGEMADGLATINNNQLDMLVGAVVAELVIRGATSEQAARRVCEVAWGGAFGSDAFDREHGPEPPTKGDDR